MVLSGNTYHILSPPCWCHIFSSFLQKCPRMKKCDINMANLKMWYVFPESTIDAYIVENFSLDTKKHLWKILGKFSQVFTLFHNTFRYTKKFDFLRQNMRVYNVLWNQYFPINVEHLKSLYLIVNVVYVTYMIPCCVKITVGCCRRSQNSIIVQMLRYLYRISV